MSSIVRCDSETIEWRRESRGYRLVRLRISERVDGAEIRGNLFVGGRLEKNVWIVARLQ